MADVRGDRFATGGRFVGGRAILGMALAAQMVSPAWAARDTGETLVEGQRFFVVRRDARPGRWTRPG